MTVNAQNVEGGGLGADVGSIGDCDGVFSDEDASGKRQAAVAKDNAALKARLVKNAYL